MKWVAMSLMAIGVMLESACAAETAKPLRVAIGEFSVDDNSYRSSVAASTFSTALQAALSQEKTGVEWVERSQLEAADHELNYYVSGFDSKATALRIGKWLKADLLILGHFEIQEGKGRLLRIEVVDLDHADVLAEKTLPISGSEKEPLAISGKDVNAAVGLSKQALEEARKKLEQVRNKLVVAPLFFSNSDASRRLDYFEGELLAAFQETAAASQSARVIRFPKASESSDEADLVVGGLVEADANAWQKVADLFVWGDFAEDKVGNDVSFEQTPVKATMNIWDGHGEIQTFAETGTVAQLKGLKQKLAAHLADAIKAYHKQAPADAVRHKVARELVMRGTDIEGRFTSSPALFRTQDGQRLWRQALNMYVAARFFEPESYEINRKLIFCEGDWYRTLKGGDAIARNRSEDPNTFGFYWGRLLRWNAFLARFGYHPPSTVDGELLARLFPMGGLDGVQSPDFDSMAAVRSVGLLASFVFACDAPNNSDVSGFPRDAPPEILEKWREQFLREFGEKVILISKEVAGREGIPDEERYSALPNFQQNMRTAFKIGDARLRARAVEALWPFLLAHETYMRQTALQGGGKSTAADFDRSYYHQEYMKGIQQTFTAVDATAKGAEMAKKYRDTVVIEEKNMPPKPAPAPAPPMELVTLDFHPPVLDAPVRSVVFPSKPPITGIVTLLFHENRLWISGRKGFRNSSPGLNFQLAYLIESSVEDSLWICGEDGRDLAPVSEKIGCKSKVTSMTPYQGQMWLTLMDGGVWSVDRDFKVRRFGDKEGVVSPLMFAGAEEGGRLYFAGGEPEIGLVNVHDPKAGTWKRLDVDQTVVDRCVYCESKVLPQIQRMGIFEQSLIVGASSQIAQWRDANILKMDLKTGKWTNLDGELLQGYLRPKTAAESYAGKWPPFLYAVEKDDSGLWLGITGGLIRYNPTRNKIQTWFSDPDMGIWEKPKTVERIAQFSKGGKLPAGTYPFTRLQGSVTALASDGEFLWVGATTNGERWNQTGSGGDETDSMIIFEKAQHRVYLLHKPSGRWVGCFAVPRRVSSLAVSSRKLWIGLEGPLSHLISPLLEVDKQQLLSIPPSRWVSDTVTEQEFREKTGGGKR